MDFCRNWCHKMSATIGLFYVRRGVGVWLLWELRRRMAMAGAIFASLTPNAAPSGRQTQKEASHGYRLLSKAHDRKRRVGHVFVHGRSGEHQGRGQALSAGQYGLAERHGQENRVLADGCRTGAAVRTRP